MISSLPRLTRNRNECRAAVRAACNSGLKATSGVSIRDGGGDSPVLPLSSRLGRGAMLESRRTRVYSGVAHRDGDRVWVLKGKEKFRVAVGREGNAGAGDLAWLSRS